MCLAHIIEECGMDVAKRVAVWGTYGKEGKGPLQWVLLHERDTDHLQAILRTQHPRYIGWACVKVIHSILADRNVVPEEWSHEATEAWARKMLQSPDTDKELLRYVN